MESCPVLKRIRKWIWKCKLGPPNENLKGLKRLNNNTYLRGNKVLKQDSEWMKGWKRGVDSIGHLEIEYTGVDSKCGKQKSSWVSKAI